MSLVYAHCEEVFSKDLLSRFSRQRVPSLGSREGWYMVYIKKAEVPFTGSGAQERDIDLDTCVGVLARKLFHAVPMELI